jgi:CO/xanthine dehydrogenase FAD-binding subunit
MALPELKEFCLPETGGEVTSLLDKYGDSALFVAGGTFIHGLEARGFLSGVEALIDLRKLGLDKITPDQGGTRVGATVNFAALKQLPDISTPAYGALRDALAYPPAQILNLATVGGSIAAACPFFDIPAAFQVLDGSVTITGAGGERNLDLADVYAGIFENTLAENEYIASLLLPKQDAGSSSAYLKLETNANDLALVGVGVRITLGGGLLGKKDKISNARVVLGGGLNGTFVRSAAAEDILNGERAGDELFEQAAQAITADIDPISDHRCSAEYRAAIGKLYVRRALQTAVQRLN